MPAIITISQLEVAARRPSGTLEDNPYANFCLTTASETVVDIAQHPEWEDVDFEGVVPREAKRIALTVAVRAFSNPELEIAWGTGPLSGRHADAWALGFELSEYELEQLEALQGGGPGSKTGLWVQPTAGGIPEVGEIYLKDPWWLKGSTPILYQDEGDVGTDPIEGS